MNLTNNPKNPFLLFLKVTGQGFLIFLTITIGILFIRGGLRPTSFDLDLIPRNFVIILQVIQMVTLFVFPPLLFAKLSKNSFFTAFQLNKPIKPLVFIYGIIFALALFPALITLAEYIEQLDLPYNIKLMAEKQKISMEKGMSFLLDSSSICNFVIMILLVGFGAGFTEELYFRGLMMHSITNLIKDYRFGILWSASIFSLLHFSIYNFLPITIVGILFGYLYYYSQDLKLNIFIHSFFNAFQVLLHYLHYTSLIPFDIDTIKIPWYLALSSAILAIFIYRLILKSYENVSHSG